MSLHSFRIDAPHSSAEVLAQSSESAENQANVVDLIANGFNYLPWHG